MKKQFVALALSALLGWQNLSQACSVTQSPPGWPFAVGHNFDWYVFAPNMKGAFGFTPRSLVKRTNPVGGQAGIEWRAAYASYTYTILASEFPMAGVNEVGLFVAVQEHLGGQNAPDSDAPTTLNPAQWVQYQLDNSATIADVVASGSVVKPGDSLFRTHYFTCDRTRACAVIEWVNGVRNVYMGEALPYPMMTNSHYPDSLAAANACESLGCMNSANTSLARFANLAYIYDRGGTQSDTRWLWRTMEYIRNPFPDSTVNGTSTRHHLMYDFANQRMAVRFPDTRTEAHVNLDFRDADCATRPSRLAVLEPTQNGNIEASLAPLSLDTHLDLCRNSGIPESSWSSRVGYALDPAKVSCAR